MALREKENHPCQRASPAPTRCRQTGLNPDAAPPSLCDLLASQLLTVCEAGTSIPAAPPQGVKTRFRRDHEGSLACRWGAPAGRGSSFPLPLQGAAPSEKEGTPLSLPRCGVQQERRTALDRRDVTRRQHRLPHRGGLTTGEVSGIVVWSFGQSSRQGAKPAAQT